MLDNNIWTYLVEANSVDELRLEAWSQRVDIVMPPAIVIEALQARPTTKPDLDAKHRRITAMTSSAWVRLMPEAYKEATEVQQEVARLRPQWIDPLPRLRDWNRNKLDWQGKWWDFVRQTPDEAARVHEELSEGRTARAQADTRRARSEAMQDGRTFERIDFVQSARLYVEETGWAGDPFESWRGEAMNRWFAALSQRGPDNDWLAAWLKVDEIDRSDWATFWMRDVDQERVPLNWLRWAFGHVQSTRATNAGTPVDNQIATYLPESDVFVTADRVFASCIAAVSPHSPVRLAEPIAVPANIAAVEETLLQLDRLGSR
ncbi:hypothetical protein ACFPJ4_00345 [Lysinimonas soli]|uniref:PIN domain-containing protein n=1 Tax=Lysinimonas soli TaxID=1074233 RepID=A0ABW0NKY2_9MICO